MKRKTLSLSSLGFLFCIAANAASVTSPPAFIDFENVPMTSTQPSLFVQASQQPQTITVPNVAAISGGVILGNATNFPAQSYATPPNVYGTANLIGGSQLLSTITIAIDPSYSATEVSFPLFNGYTNSRTYTATAYDGTTILTSSTVSAIPANTSSGYTIVDLIGSDITSVAITPEITSTFDFAIDSIAFNQSVTQVITPSGDLITSMPEPQTFALLGAGLIGVFLARRQSLPRE